MDALIKRLRQSRLVSEAKAIPSYVEAVLGQKTIYRVHDKSSWALYWVAYYIAKGLDALKVHSQSIDDPRYLRHQIIHFDSRHHYLNNPAKDLHSSNHAFLTWFHGAPDDSDFKPLFEKLMDRADALDGVVTSTSQTFSRMMDAGFPQEKLHLIPIGVDTAKFHPPSHAQRQQMRQSLGIAEHEFCIGSFQKDGNGWNEGLEPKLIKGPDVFLEVIGQVKTKHPNLVVLLTGPARGYVKAGLDKMGIRYIHHFLDEYHAIVPYYHALDLYLITSRDEGGPKGFMESWASLVPVVSTAMGMPADYIRHGENGFLAPIDDSTQLARIVLSVIKSPDMIEDITQQASVDVQQLDWIRVARQYYEKLYRPILE